MTDLSPAAQAVIQATAVEACLSEWGPVNDPPCHPDDEGWKGCHLCIKSDLIAAAFRVAAAYLPSSAMYPSSDWGHGWRSGINDARQGLLTIAAELESAP